MGRKIVNVRFRTAAREDILRQFRYYLVEKEVPEVAERFLDEVEAAIATLCRAPGIGTPKLFSNPLTEGIEVMARSGFPCDSHLLHFRRK